MASPLEPRPVIPAEVTLPEITVKAVILSVVLAAVLAGANAYLGLFAGMTVSASIPAAVIGGRVRLGESGLRLWGEALEGAARVGRAVVYGGVNLSPALLAVGFIIGPNTASVVFLGGALSWLILLPLYSAWLGSPENLPAIEAAKSIGSTHIRHVGIGAMLVGGLWTLVQLRGPLLEGVRRAVAAYRQASTGGAGGRGRHSSKGHASAPLWVFGALALGLVPVARLSYTVVPGGL